LATSDLHMQITAFDYVRDCPNTGGSLARLATLIEKDRAAAESSGATCFLFDNGDTFQGTPVADFVALQNSDDTHSMAAAINHLRYDAIGLGNHDFDHGMERLGRNLSQLDVPVVCSNLLTSHLPMVRSSLQCERAITLSNGGTAPLKVGVLSTLPDKTALWGVGRLQDRASFIDPVEAIRTQSARLRADGVDLIIALAHMGLATFDEGPEAQNRIEEVAKLENVDVVIGGHTHLRFPGRDHEGLEHIDWQAGKVHGTPVVQPGPGGMDLGVIDLELEKPATGDKWVISSADVALHSAASDTAEAEGIISLAKPLHAKTRAHLDTTVASIADPMHSYFALVSPSPLPAMLANAKRRVIREALAGTEYEEYPLLAAASTSLTGGMDGPDNFLFLDKGPIKRRHVAGLNPYANSVWAVKVSGARIIDWLERAALIFSVLKEDAPDQALIDTHVPGFRYDAIYGLEYEIDPSQTPLCDINGRQTGTGTGRIRHVTWQGVAIDPEQTFLVATTDHRAGGGGLYLPIKKSDIIVRWQTQLQDAVLAYLQDPDCGPLRSEKPWKFAPDIGRHAILHSAPEAEAHLDEIAHLRPELCGLSPEGFLRIRIAL